MSSGSTSIIERSPQDQPRSLPTVAVLLPAPMRAQMLAPEAERHLAAAAHVVAADGPALTPEDLPGLLEGAVACLTGWGTPPLSEDLLASCPDLRFVAHSAGSIHRLVPAAAIERGLRVSSAARVIADAVAETVILQALLCLRELHEIDRSMKASGAWEVIRQQHPGRLLGNLTVGVVGTGHVGRAVIHLFRPFGCRILAFDPFLTPDQAQVLGVEVVSLDALFQRSDVVTLHAPVLPETRSMIGARQFGLLRDGGVFINTARAALVDEEALLRALETGRFTAALDVYEREPLPEDSRFRSLPNVVLSPHAAGHTIETHFRQGQVMVEEVGRFLQDAPLEYEVTAEMLPIIA